MNEPDNRLATFERMTQTSNEALDNRFTHHGDPSDAQVAYYSVVREKLATLAKFVCDHTPACREQSLALTALEEAMFYAIAACARNRGHYPENPPV